MNDLNDTIDLNDMNDMKAPVVPKGRRHALRVLAAALSPLAPPSLSSVARAAPAAAQDYPSRAVRLIVPYPVGGGTDFFARTVSERLAARLGQPVVVENRPGAATIIGADQVAKSPPDGYTVLLADSTTIAVNPSLYPKLPYDPARDLAPVSLTARFAMLLVTGPAASAKADTLADWMDLVRKSDGRMSYASAGAGTTHHLTMELFLQRTGLKLTHVPYKGAGPAIQDVASGQVPCMFVDLAAGGPMVRAGKLKVLGVASRQRIDALPDVKTLDEQGIAGFEAWAWQGLTVPAGVNAAIIAKLNAEYAKVVAEPEIARKLTDAGIEPMSSTPERMAEYRKSEAQKWAEVIRQAGIKVE